jgi:hypothetical protein
MNALNADYIQRSPEGKTKLYCTDPEHEDFDTVIQDVYLGTSLYD